MRIRNPELKENILHIVIPMFAKSGYTGVSMRDIAAAVKMTPAALYHHFPDKESLYLDVLNHAFSRKAEGLVEALNQEALPEKKLEALVSELCRIMAEDPDFHALMQRELLENDTARMQMLAKEVFHEFFIVVSQLALELGPRYDTHLLVISIIGLVVYHYETVGIRPFLPGCRPGHDKVEVVARHITTLLTNGLFRSNLPNPSEQPGGIDKT